VADVPEEMISQAAVGAVNHPKWTIGHLIYSAQALGGELGIQPWLTADWQRKYGTGSTPQHDGPSKVELLALLNDAQQRVVASFTAIGEAGMSQPLPDARYRDTFPSLGHAVLHVLSAHTASHVGQLIVWRRAAGLEPVVGEFV
jgi:hypothetical protein